MLRRALVCATLLLATMGIGNAHNTTRANSSPNIVFGGQFSPVQPAARHTHFSRKTARLRHQLAHPGHRTVLVLPKDSSDLVTVPTAAGISIRVERKLAPQFEGFIEDLVKMGYTPKHIGCWAPQGTHVPNSNHYHGGACDFDQTGWGRTAPTMYHIGSLARKWGLRDGCTFHRPDCGHVDDGTNLGWKHPNNIIAKYIDYQSTPSKVELETFEE